MKTTNAKAKGIQTPAGPTLGKDLDKPQSVQTSTRRPKRVTHAETTKIAVHGDESPLAEREVEYAPPKPKDLPYESDDFPSNCLNYNALKPGNLTRGWYDQYHGPINKQREIENEEAYVKSAKSADEQIRKMMEEDWIVGDVPETFRHLRKKGPLESQKPKALNQVKKPVSVSTKGPSTINSRNAASALSSAPTSSALASKALMPKAPTSLLSRAKKPEPVAPPLPSTMRHTAAAAASRSTIGYTKGRNAISALKKREAGVPMPRAASTLSHGSDATITPDRYAQKASAENEQWSRLKLLGAFDVDDADLEPGLRGVLPDCVRTEEDDGEEFVLTLA